MVKYTSGESNGVQFTLEEEIIPIGLNIYFPIRYMKMWVLVKRNEQVIHYCTQYTPFRIERAIQP